MARNDAEKELLLEYLKKTPIIKVACEKAGIPRTNFYRWYEEDENFRKAVDLATIEGKLSINDISEYQILSLIQDKHPSTIRYWLEHHHPDYMKKNANVATDDGSPSVIMLHDSED